MKTRIVALMLVLIVGLAAGCQTTTTNVAGDEEKYQEMLWKKEKELIEHRLLYQKPLENRLSVGVFGSPLDFNPFYTKDPAAKTVNQVIYDPLFFADYSDGPGSLEMRLLDSLNISEDQLTYTLKLKGGIQWHDGKPLTAEDVRYTLEYIQSHQTVYQDLMSVQGQPVVARIQDELNLVITLPAPSNSFLYKLSEVAIVPAHVFSALEDNSLPMDQAHYVGSGPFRFVGMTLLEIETDRNDNYYGNKPKLEGIRFVNCVTPHSARTDLLNGDVQVGYMQNSEDGAFINSFHQLKAVNEGLVKGVLFNTQSPLMQNKDIRAALLKMINTNTLMDLVGPTRYNHLADSIFSEITKYRINSDIYHNYNPAEAKEALLSYQMQDSDFMIHLGFISEEGEYQEKMAIILQEAFKSQGINLKLVPLYERDYWKQLVDPAIRTFDFVLYDYAIGEIPDAYRNYFSADGLSNYGLLADKNATALWWQADSTSSEKEAEAIYQQIQKQILDELIIYPLVYSKALLAIDDRVQGVEEARIAYGVMFEKWEELSIEEIDQNNYDLTYYDIDLEKIEDKKEKLAKDKVKADALRLENLELDRRKLLQELQRQ